VLHADVAADRRDFTVRATLSAGAGERVAVFGPTGSGKTTVLEAIAGLIPARGRVTLGGRPLAGPDISVPPRRRRVGLLRPDPGLFPHLTAGENLRYARAARRSSPALIADYLGIADLLDEKPAALSREQRLRVALGRQLLAGCDTLLLDEPFATLDLPLRRSLENLVKAFSAERPMPSVLATHDLDDAQAFADRLVVIDRGRVRQTGTPSEVVLRPASARVASLVGYQGFVPSPSGAVCGVHPDRVVAGVFPGHGLVLDGRVLASRACGAGWEADLHAAGAVITCRLPERPAGRDLTVTVVDPPYFDPDGMAVTTGRR
jgi:ABC-type sulfate/molybdate transport systems ATPase subunit